jgi:hypothetical protein
LIALK